MGCVGRVKVRDCVQRLPSRRSRSCLGLGAARDCPAVGTVELCEIVWATSGKVDTIVCQCSAVLQLLASENQPLFHRRNPLLVVELRLHICNGMMGFHVQRDAISSECHYDDLHCALQREESVRRVRRSTRVESTSVRRNKREWFLLFIGSSQARYFRFGPNQRRGCMRRVNMDVCAHCMYAWPCHVDIPY